MSKPQANSHDDQGPMFDIERLYVKDVSFESPKPMDHMRNGATWQPEVEVNLQVGREQLSHELYEVALRVTVSVQNAGKVAFVVEVEQAGSFIARAVPADDLDPLLGSVCPGILFPYARQVVSDLVLQGGFPPLYLSPVNFSALYESHLARETEAASEAKEAEKNIEPDTVH